MPRLLQMPSSSAGLAAVRKQFFGTRPIPNWTIEYTLPPRFPIGQMPATGNNTNKKLVLLIFMRSVSSL